MKTKTKMVIITAIVCMSVVAFASLQLIQPSLLQTDRNNLTNEQELIQHSLMKMLYPYIQEAITSYYGYSKQFMDDEILDISMYGPYDIKVKIRVTTFEGPHNPPYGTEEITLVLSDKVEILEFAHKDEILPR